ncbi:KTSC domain-containing protein [Cohnella kolymensis]|uniref:KTSC domain-containing protein n=1 Tax=Cohnella kolymensis TaxID=1590652 RepID=UPI0006985AE0|nr:KTSC domain-containing protein [Cohnella kolymensis]
MQLTPVVSSNIAAVGYNNFQNILIIQFLGKTTTYSYYGVPVETYEEMMASKSVGSFYAKNIKGRFPNEPQRENGGGAVAGDS